MASSSSSSSTSSTSTSTSLLPSEPLPWRPNTRPKLPPGALLDIADDLLWDLFTEWLPLEAVCRLDSALCQKRRRPYFLSMLATKVLLFNREEIRVLTNPDLFTHKALGAAALNWILKRGINLASLQLPGYYSITSAAEQQIIRDAVASLALNGHLDKLETVSLEWCKCIKDADFAAILSKCYSSIKSIFIRGCGLTESAVAYIKRCTKLEAFSPQGNESVADMVEIFQSCRKLRMVDLNAFVSNKRLADDVVKSLADHSHLLEHLNLYGCDGVSDEAIIAVAESCPLLKYVSLSYTYYITDASVVALCKQCPLLKQLFLAECNELTDAAVLAVAERLPGLTHIDLNGIGTFTSSAVETLASKCRALEFIDLSYCFEFSDAAIMKIAEYCSKLEELRVGGCDNVTDAAVLAVAERLPGLTHIDLSCIDAITSSAVETLASKCCALESINLSRCPNVSDATLMKIAEYCSKLKGLRVNACPNVTAVGIAEVQSKCSMLNDFWFNN